MLTKLHLRNFKCFGELALPLAPLTLLTGLNASGKSTALQTLLLLSQSQRTDSDAPEVRLNGPLVRLGTPGEVLNENGKGRQLTLGVEDSQVRVDWTLVAEDRQRGMSMRVSEVRIRSSGEDRVFRQPKSLYRLLPKEASDGHVLTLANHIREVVYVSATRGFAQEVFPSPEETSPTQADVGMQGEYAPWWLDQYLDEDVDEDRCNSSDTAQTLRRQVNAWAKELFAGAEVNVQRVPRTSLTRLELRSSDTEDWRRPSNIGFGLTYAVPILVASLIAGKGQVIVIDSPEAHLHPRGQSQLGRFIARMAAAGVQIVVETHSDHFLNGVRLALRDRTILAESLAIHFFARPSSFEAGAQVISPAIDDRGNLSEWPKGFFDQFEDDLAQLAGWDK